MQNFLQSLKIRSYRSQLDFVSSYLDGETQVFYPFLTFAKLMPNASEALRINFAPITIFSGGNGTGKSTLLNIIAELLGAGRAAPFNTSRFFSVFSKGDEKNESFASVVFEKEPKHIRIITSDDIFKSLIQTREKNDELANKREALMEEYFSIKHPKTIEDAQKIREKYPIYDRYLFEKFQNVHKMTLSGYIKFYVGKDTRTYSNGESVKLFFSDLFQDDGLYLLDEPENSLSPQSQILLHDLIFEYSRFQNCQFILATHSPFLLGLPAAKIFDLDSSPLQVSKFEKLKCVRDLARFLQDRRQMRHDDEFKNNDEA